MKLWALLPIPQAPKPKQLTPLPETEVNDLREKIREYLKEKADVRRFESIETVPGKPANHWFCIKQYNQFEKNYNANKPKLYFLMGTHLKLADKMLRAEEQEVRTSGVGIIRQVITCCLLMVKDPVLSEMVGDAYLIPELDNASPKQSYILSEYHLMHLAIAAYQDANRPEMVERICGRAIDLVGFNRNLSDTWRLQLADALKQQGRWDDAFLVLKDIHDPSVVAARDQYFQKYKAEQARLNNDINDPPQD